MTRCLTHLASTGLVAGAMAAAPVGLAPIANTPGLHTPVAQVRGGTGRPRLGQVGAERSASALALVLWRAAAADESDEEEETGSEPGEARAGEDDEDDEDDEDREIDNRRFGGVEQVGPDLSREEEEAAIEGGWGD